MSLRQPQATNHDQNLVEKLQKLSGLLDLLEHRGGAPWRNLPYQTIWQDYGGEWEKGRYFRDPLGMVWVKGLIKTSGGSYGYNAGNATIANLPEGFRPATAQFFAQFQHCSNNDQLMVLIKVFPNGDIIIMEDASEGTELSNNGVASYLNLNGIQFYAGL